MIYIVEDDAEIRELEVYALKSSGFESKAFESGKPMDEEVKVMVPDLFILDIMLPGEDGLSILKRLRAQENTKNVPIIMITAKSSELDKVKGLDLGADINTTQKERKASDVNIDIRTSVRLFSNGISWSAGI